MVASFSPKTRLVLNSSLCWEVVISAIARCEIVISMADFEFREGLYPYIETGGWHASGLLVCPRSAATIQGEACLCCRATLSTCASAPFHHFTQPSSTARLVIVCCSVRLSLQQQLRTSHPPRFSPFQHLSPTIHHLLLRYLGVLGVCHPEVEMRQI